MDGIHQYNHSSAFTDISAPELLAGSGCTRACRLQGLSGKRSEAFFLGGGGVWIPGRNGFQVIYNFGPLGTYLQSSGWLLASRLKALDCG